MNFPPLYADMEKDHKKVRFDPKKNHLKKCIDFDKSEFSTKQRNMYLTTNMSKTRLPHIFRGKNYEINFMGF